MKVLIICDVLFPQTVGGSGRVARELAVGLRRLGVEPAFFTRAVDEPPGDESFPVRYYPGPGSPGSSRIAHLFREEVERFGPDLFHIHQPLPAYLALSPDETTPCVYTFHSSWSDELLARSSSLPKLATRSIAVVAREVERRVIDKAAAIVALSTYSANLLKEAYGRDATIIPGGIDLERFQPAVDAGSARREADDGFVRLITVRNLVPRMGLDELIRAMADLPDRVLLDIAGDGPMKQPLGQLIGELGLESRVRLLGRIDDARLPRFYSDADWFVLPSRELEGFGMVILESLACGTGVLGTRVGAIAELLEAVDPGWIIESPTCAAIAETIRRVLARPRPDPLQLRRFATRYAWDAIAERYARLFSDVLDGTLTPR